MFFLDMESTIQDIPKTNTHTQSSDEITNKVFQEVLQRKSENSRPSHMSDQGSLKVINFKLNLRLVIPIEIVKPLLKFFYSF